MIQIKKQHILVFCILFTNTWIFSQTTLNLVNSYSISDAVGEPSGLAYDKENDQLFAVSDKDDIYRLSTSGNLLDTYDFEGDLEGISMYNTSNTLLVAIEDTYQIIEYNYVTGESTSHTMDYDNQEDSGSGIEGVTFNSNTGEIYFLNEKDPGALIVANSNFNVTDEYELTYAGDYSASYYVEETNTLWLGSDDSSTIYKCDTEGNVSESFEMTFDGDDLDKLEGIAVDYTNQLLYVITDGGGELLVYKIESETENDSLTVSSISDFDADGGSQSVTISSNIDWTVSESSSWISINNTSDSDNGTFTITVNENTSTNDRSTIVTVSGDDITRSLTVSQEGAQEEETEETDNLALDGNASQSSTASNGVASHAIDGDTNGNYSDNSVTHTSATTGSWWQVELNSQTNIGDIIIYNRTNDCCIDRLSNFTVEVYDNNGNVVYSQTITQAPETSVIINADDVVGKTIRITTNLTDSPLSLAEVEVFEGKNNETENTSCSSGTNLALNRTIVDFSDQQNTTNAVDNILDENDDNRWSAETFPQYATVDLGDEYAIDEINLVTYNNRDYQFIVEGSTSSATSGFSTLVDASDNSDDGPINRTFNSQTVRYVKLTITGANSYSGNWNSIINFEIICAGNNNSSSNKNILEQEATDLIDITVSPNPYTETITISSEQKIGSVQLTDLTGKSVVEKVANLNEATLNNLDYIAKGVYILQILNTNNQIIKLMKVVKE